MTPITFSLSHFPFQSSHKALAPLALQASRFVGDKPIFKAIGALLPASVFSDDTFRKDREFFNGANINPKKLKTLAPMFLSLLQHHMTDLEKQLKASEGEFLLGNQPSYADISFYWLLAVIRNAHRDDQDSLVTELFSQDLRRKSYIKVIEWMKLMDQVFEKLSYYGPSPGPDSSLGGQKIDSEEAQRLLESGKRVERMVDEHEALVANGWFKKGDEVIVTPDDTGKTHPQCESIQADRIPKNIFNISARSSVSYFRACSLLTSFCLPHFPPFFTAGILIGLTPETGTLEVKTSRNKSLHVHFPRHGYVIAKKPKNSKL